MDPEQIYAEVLSEEQQKGSAAAVAEGRAKAARARAEAGSPTPKEPKWWPGSQPHFEGGEAPAEEPAEAPTVQEPVAEEAPAAAEAPAAEPAPVASAEPAPAAVAAPPPAAADQPAAAVAPAAEQPAAATPTPVSATAPVPVAVAAPPATPAAEAVQPLPSGVSAGTTTGTRLRPEDESATEAQFAGQQAMYQRRKLIDELVSTGVPVVTAGDSGGSRGGAFMLLLYLLIPIAAIAILAGVNNESAPATGSGGGSTPAAPSGPSLTAQNVAFTTSSLNLPADKPVTLHFDNKDSTPHNVGIYDKEGGKELFKGSVITGGQATDYEIDPLKAGTYYFQCDLHPASMKGDVTVK